MSLKPKHNLSYFSGFLAVITLFSAVKFWWPVITKNNLLIWDMAGHFYSAIFTAQYLFPRVIGWNPFFFLGFPQNQFYPPLFVYLTAALSATGIFSLEYVFKGLLLFSVFATPVAFYFFGRTFGLNKKTAAFFMLFAYGLMFLPDWIIMNNGTPGGNFYSTFNIGLVENGFIFPFLFVYVAIAYRALQQRRYVLPAVILALIVVAHIIVGFTAIVFTLVLALSKANHRGNIVAGAKLLGLAFFLSAFWTVPFLAKIAYTNSIKINLGTSAAFLLVSALAIVLGLYFNTTDRREPKIIFYCLGVLYSTVALFDFINLELHLNRFNFFIFIFTAYLLFYFFQLHWRRWYIKTALYGSCIASIVMVAFGSPLINTAGTNSIYFEQPQLADGRVAVLLSFYRDASVHVPTYLFQLRSGAEVVKGLFVESAKNSRMINNFEKELNLRSFDWGLPTDWEQIREYSIYRNGDFVADHLDLFNVNYIVSNFIFSSTAADFRLIGPVGLDQYRPQAHDMLPGLDQPVDFQYYLYRVNDSQRFAVLEYAPGAFSGTWAEWEQRVVDWFFSPRVKQVLVYNQPDVAWQPGSQNDHVELIDHSPTWERFTINVSADHDVPVLIKMSYFPNWQAFVDGHKIPIYMASPYLMLVNTHGTVEFRYLPTFWDRLGLILSIIGIFVVIAGTFRFIKQQRQQ